MSAGYVILHDDGARLTINRVRLGEGKVLLDCSGYFESRDECMLGRATVYANDDTVIFSTWQGNTFCGAVRNGNLTMTLPLQVYEVTKNAELDWRR